MYFFIFTYSHLPPTYSSPCSLAKACMLFFVFAYSSSYLNTPLLSFAFSLSFLLIFLLHIHILFLLFLFAYFFSTDIFVLVCLSLFIAENLLKSDEPVWDETKFTVYGKWMDGWESRRKRTEGYDWCIIKLNIPGDVHSFEIDTCHFTGNYSPMVSVQACYLDQDPVSSLFLCTVIWVKSV